MRFKVNQVRSFSLEGVDKTQVDSAFLTVAISSETPVLRSFGNEVLLHGKDNIDLSRTVPNGLPLIINHNDTQLPVGRLKNIRLDPDLKLRGDAYFSGRPEAQSVKQDILDDIISDVSVGYRILAHKVVKGEKDGPNTFNVTRWMPCECSLVGVPADPTVGFGRSQNGEDEESEVAEADQDQEPLEVPGDDPIDPPAAENQVELENQETADEIPAGTEPGEAKNADVEVAEAIEETGETDENRSLNIDSSENIVKQELLNTELLALRSVAIKQKIKTEVEIDTIIKRNLPIEETRNLLLKTDSQNKSIVFIKENNKMLSNEMIFRSLSHAIKGEFGKLEGDSAGFITQTGARQFSADLFTRADAYLGDTVASNMTSAGFGDEGNFQQYIGFLDLLRARAVCLKAGARTRSGSGSLAYIREITPTTVVTKAEDSGPAANSYIDFMKVPYLPRALVATVYLTDELQKESLVDLQQVLRQDMVKQLALKIDNMAINGVTSPYTVNGLLSAGSAIQNGNLGTAGIPTFVNVNNLKALVDAYDVDLSTCSYILTPGLMNILETTSKGTSIFVPIAQDNKINGYSALTSTNVPIASGTNHSLIFGDFSNLEVALMGPTEFMVDIQTRFNEGITILTARQYVDIGVLQPNAFAAAQNCHIV